MSFLDKIFGSTNEEHTPSKMNWLSLDNSDQLEEIAQLSNEKQVLIFKHSTRCSISRMALKQFEKEFDQSDKIVPYFLDLLAFRSVSNEIAARFGVMHQSPQLIVIKNGKAIYNASHSDIDAGDLKQLV